MMDRSFPKLSVTVSTSSAICPKKYWPARRRLREIVPTRRSGTEGNAWASVWKPPLLPFSRRNSFPWRSGSLGSRRPSPTRWRASMLPTMQSKTLWKELAHSPLRKWPTSFRQSRRGQLSGRRCMTATAYCCSVPRAFTVDDLNRFNYRLALIKYPNYFIFFM